MRLQLKKGKWSMMMMKKITKSLMEERNASLVSLPERAPRVKRRRDLAMPRSSRLQIIHLPESSSVAFAELHTMIKMLPKHIKEIARCPMR